MPTHSTYLLYGAQCSGYTARARSYLIKKNIAYVERVPSGWTYLVTVRRRFGQPTIPVLVTPAGEWVVDSNLIIDRLERDFPEYPVTPADPVQALASMLIDAWATEMWLPAIMGTRWRWADINYPAWREEIGEGFFVGLPKFLKNALVDRIARTFSGYLPILGATDEDWPNLEAWMFRMLDTLDRHFAAHPYMLGERATRADFGLALPMFCHLARDPSSRPYVQQRPNLYQWIWRMQQPYPTDTAPPLPAAGTPLPATLGPVIDSIAGEMLPLADATLDALRPIVAKASPGHRLPRHLPAVEYPFGNGRHRRLSFVILLWYLQRARDLVAAMSPADAERCRAWLAATGGNRLLEMDIPRLRLLGGTTLALA
jgi:glutathione S-transferase